LANALKERRVALCEQYNACKVSPADHDAEDARLAELERALFALWDARRLGEPEGATRLTDGLRAIHVRFDGTAGDGPPAAAPVTPIMSREKTIPGESLARIDGPTAKFRAAAGSLSAVTEDGPKRDVLSVAADALGIEPGHRYQVRVRGKFSSGAGAPV